MPTQENPERFLMHDRIMAAVTSPSLAKSRIDRCLFRLSNACKHPAGRPYADY